MAGNKFRWLGFGLVASAGAGLLALTSMMNSAFAYGQPTPLFPPGSPDLPSTTELMGATGLPIPSTDPSYVAAAEAYIQAFLPGSTPVELFTPEGLYPLTGTKSLPLDQSVSQGLTILDNAITPQLTAGTPVGVLGVSQSADISSLEMEKLDPAGTPSDLPASFVLLGDEMNPNGGFLSRFPGLDLASIGLKFYGATPADSFPTVIYTHEYDGFADFCQYPINAVCDINAFLGILIDHSYTAADIPTAFTLPTSGATETTYYMIPTPDLPLTDLLRAVPVVGNPLADLLQPDLTYIVNMGFGDPDYGYSTGPANIPTPFGLFPSLADFEKLPGLLASGAEQGIHDFIGDFTGTGPNPVTHSLSSLSALISHPGSLVTDFVDAVNTLSGDASTAYASLLGTADFANALLTSLPAYDVSLFVDNLSHPIDAIGLPIAAEVGITTMIGAFELEVLAIGAGLL